MRVFSFEVWVEAQTMYVHSKLKHYDVGHPPVTVASSFFNSKPMSDEALSARLVKEMQILTTHTL